MVQDHHRAMIDGQPAEATLELVAINDRAQSIRAPWLVSREETEVRRPLAGPATLGVAGTNEEAIRPGIEARRVAKLGQVSPDGRATPAALHPRRARCRAGSCAPPHGDGRPQRRPGSRMPARRRVAPESPGRCPCRSTPSCRHWSTRSHGMGLGSHMDGTNFVVGATRSRFRERATSGGNGAPDGRPRRLNLEPPRSSQDQAGVAVRAEAGRRSRRPGSTPARRPRSSR